MLKLIELMKSKKGKIVVSILLALGLASLLRMSFKNANMVIIKGPSITTTDSKIFSFDNKCYSYKTVTTSCKAMEDNKKNLD
jgi:hypothetical protein